MDNTVLIIEDQEYLRLYTKKILVKEGYQVLTASNGREGLKLINNNVDLILLDLNLGDMDGQDIIQILRRQHNEIPIIVVSTFNEIDIKVNSFDLGCDDYITKPFYKEELLARIRRIQKRVKLNEYNDQSAQKNLKAGPFQIDFIKEIVKKNGKILPMNKKLFDLFCFLVSHKNQILSKERILTQVWSSKDSPTENTLTVHIHMLRDLIEENPKKNKHLITKRGSGYLFQYEN